MQTHVDLGPDPVAQKAVAGNARLALVGGGEYLLRHLDPKTPPELADAVRSFANNLEDIGMNALAEVPGNDPAQAARLSEGEAGAESDSRSCASERGGGVFVGLMTPPPRASIRRRSSR